MPGVTPGYIEITDTQGIRPYGHKALMPGVIPRRAQWRREGRGGTSSSPAPRIESAPSQACNTKTARSISPEQVKQLGYSWGKALAHEKVKFHR